MNFILQYRIGVNINKMILNAENAKTTVFFTIHDSFFILFIKHA